MHSFDLVNIIEFEKLKWLHSGQVHEQEECTNCLYSLSSMLQTVMMDPVGAVVTVNKFMVIGFD